MNSSNLRLTVARYREIYFDKKWKVLSLLRFIPGIWSWIWQIFFYFICSIKSPQCTDKYSKKQIDRDFPSLCFDVPKASNFTSGGVQNRETKNKSLGTILTSFQDSKPREK